MKFHDPWLLLLLLVLPAWLWWERRSAERGGLKFSSVASARAASSFWTELGPALLRVLRVATLALFIVSLARPQVGRRESRLKTEGIDIVLAVDVSGSMLAQDFKVNGQPLDRISVVKQVVKEFIDARTNDRIGMVAFAGRAYVASPLTLDHDWLDRNLDRVRVGLIEDGTALGSGLGTAVNRLRDPKAKSRVVVLLTDGVNNVWKVQPMDAAKAAKEFGVRVYTIGAGTQGVAKMPVMMGGQVAGYRPMQVEIDEALLKKIAELTGGQYFRATDTDSLRQIYQQIDKLEKREIETVKYEEWRELFPWFLAPGLGCLLLAVTLENTRLRRLP
jgi:Ca-activated chloride channel family protein